LVITGFGLLGRYSRSVKVIVIWINSVRVVVRGHMGHLLGFDSFVGSGGEMFYIWHVVVLVLLVRRRDTFSAKKQKKA
jgi:hypothetical protein